MFIKENTKMENKLPQEKLRLTMVSWLILPLIGAWMTTGYLLGLAKNIIKRPEVLSSQMVNNCYEGVGSPVNGFEWDGSGLITLWFDDGWYSQYSIAFPILKEFGFVGALSVATGLVQGEKYMTWPQIKRLQANGWEITSHSVSHICDQNILDNEKISYELIESQKILRSYGLQAEHFVTPCGVGNSIITEKAKEYYLSLRTAGEGLNLLPVNNPYELKIHAIRNNTSLEEVRQWIKEASINRGWLIIVFHQIGEEGGTYEASPQMFKDILRLIKDSNLPVVLPSQALNVSIYR